LIGVTCQYILVFPGFCPYTSFKLRIVNIYTGYIAISTFKFTFSFSLVYKLLLIRYIIVFVSCLLFVWIADQPNGTSNTQEMTSI